MKKSIGIMLSLLPFSLGAMEYSAGEVFVDGTVWETAWAAFVLDDQGAPNGISNWKEYAILDGKAEMLGSECLKMWETTGDAESGARTFVAYVRVDGEKVLMLDDESEPEWRLLYDFGMTVGEENVFWTPSYGSYQRRSYELSYMGIGKENLYSDVDELMRFSYVPLGDVTDMAASVWLKGIGSLDGPLEMLCYKVGGGSRLQKVWNGDKVYYEKSSPVGLDYTDDEAAPAISVCGCTVHVSGVSAGEPVSVFAADGRLVSRVHAASLGEATVDLPSAGTYIVNVQGVSRKVVLRR